MSINAFQQLTKFRNFCVANGLDIIVPFNVSAYNSSVDKDYHLSSFGRPDDNCLAVLVGSTTTTWHHFIQGVHNNQQLLKFNNPFDTWSSNVVNQAMDHASVKVDHSSLSPSVQQLYEKLVAEVDPSIVVPDDIKMRPYFSFDFSVGNRVAMQPLCHAIGLGFYDKGNFTVCHPVYGPWFSLRSVVVFDCPGDFLPEADHTNIAVVTKTAVDADSEGCSSNDVHSSVGSEAEISHVFTAPLRSKLVDYTQCELTNLSSTLPPLSPVVHDGKEIIPKHDTSLRVLCPLDLINPLTSVEDTDVFTDSSLTPTYSLPPRSLPYSTSYTTHKGAYRYSPCVNFGCGDVHAQRLQMALDNKFSGKRASETEGDLVGIIVEDKQYFDEQVVRDYLTARESKCASYNTSEAKADSTTDSTDSTLNTLETNSELFKSMLFQHNQRDVENIDPLRFQHPSLKWLTVRDACAVGTRYRYGIEQSMFHYAHDVQILKEGVDRVHDNYKAILKE